jgi:hypothetical protein
MIERSKQKTQLLAGRTSASASWLSAGFGRAGFFLNSSLTRNDGKVECYIQMSGGAEMNKKAFKGLLARKEEIEASFGSALDWQELPERAACRICTILPGGWSSPESEWPAMQDRMIDALIRLEASLRKPIQELKF